MLKSILMKAEMENSWVLFSLAWMNKETGCPVASFLVLFGF